MNTKEMLDKIISLLSADDFFRDFKFRKGDCSFISKKGGFTKKVQIQHWNYNELVLHPGFSVRFDVLLNWFKKFSLYSLQDQKDFPNFGFSSSMLGCPSSEYYFQFNGDDFQASYNSFRKELLSCANWVFENYGTLELAYQKEIIPLLNGDKEMPNGGIRWAFVDLTLCRIISPQDYDVLKKMILERIDFLHERKEPNVADYYDKLDEIISYMEGLSIEELEKCKL